MGYEQILMKTLYAGLKAVTHSPEFKKAVNNIGSFFSGKKNTGNSESDTETNSQENKHDENNNS